MKQISILGLCLIMLCTQSCATLFTGTKDVITINSVPEGAKVQVDGIDQGRTPVTIPVQRSLNGRTVTLQADGYEMRTLRLQQEFNAVSILNLLSILGWAIDLATGSVMKYSPLGYTVELDEKK
jgi:hypothetical protein